MAYLYIVRHGNTFDKGDTVTRVGARTDLPLSAPGREQARALGRHFQKEGITFSSAIAGPLMRTRQTVDAIAVEQPDKLDATIEEFLREIDYGPDENRPESEVVARIGQPALDAWETHATPPPEWTVALFERTAGAPTGDNSLAVTSNGIARFALLAAGANEHDHSLKLKTGAYGVFEIADNGTVQLVDWNIRP
jgi:probable phosphoglycerate mutase